MKKRLKKLAETFPAESKKLLCEIMEDFAEENIVFNSEKHFQFAVGCKLQRLFFEVGLDYKVEFDVPFSFNGEYVCDDWLIFIIPEEEQRKMHTDIIVDMGEKGKFAIDLKYVIAHPRPAHGLIYTVGGKKVFTLTPDLRGSSYFECKKHKGEEGAVFQNFYAKKFVDNYGCYDFWRRLARTESLKENGFVTGGLSIVLSNDGQYKKGHDDLFKNFYPVDGTTFSGTLCLFDKKKQKGVPVFAVGELFVGIKYFYPVRLNGEYTIDWNDYKLHDVSCQTHVSYENVYKDFKFGYTVVEIQ